MLTEVWLPITCKQSIVMASHCVGLTFPGIIDDPGSFSGSWISPNPDLGPDPKSLMSLAILKSDEAVVFNDPENSNSAS